MRTLLMASALVVGLMGSLSAVPVPVPYRGFCGSLWLFALPCAQISSRLVGTIESFSLPGSCAECGYMLVSASPLNIRANHSSPDGLQAENVTFTLSPTTVPSGCRVSSQSVSLGFSSRLDGGLNYCILYSLLTGSGLKFTPAFTELTNEWACLGYSLAPCRAKRAGSGPDLWIK
ncbi:uncharacterized protein LOC144388799 [Gasterosteus aculeatus]